MLLYICALDVATLLYFLAKVVIFSILVPVYISSDKRTQGQRQAQAPLGLKSAKDLSFGRREGFLARYERANALPARPRVGRARVCPFFPVSGVGCCCTPEGPPTRREVSTRGTAVRVDTVVLSNEAS